ncbi:MAG TPA: MFS transporter [Solirubrobacteraceae bacterium]|nr:MFS transporter [Solirubrobacteraceae bacterium]
MQRKWKVMLVVGVAIFMASLDLFIVNIAFPYMAIDFHQSNLRNLSWILDAYTIVFAALLVPAGRWADVLGRKRAFLFGLGVFIVSSGLCAIAPSVLFLVVARIAQAVGGAVLLPTSLGLLLPEFPPAERPIAIGSWSVVGGIAAAAGPPLGGLLVELNWRWVFLVNIPVGIAAMIAGIVVLREQRHPDAARADIFGAGLLATGVASMVLVIIQGHHWGWGGARIIGLIALSLITLTAVVMRSRRHPSPVIDLELMRVRAFSVATISAVPFFMAFSAMLLAGVLFLTKVWQEPITTTGLMLAPGPVMGALVAVPFSRLAERVGQRVVGTIGSLLFVLAGLWWAVNLTDTPHYLSTLLPGILIGGAGVGLVNPSITGAAVAALPPARLATGIAIQTTGRQIGFALGVAILVGSVATPPLTAHGYLPAWYLMIAASLASAVILALLGPVSSAQLLAAAEAPAGELAELPTASVAG